MARYLTPKLKADARQTRRELIEEAAFLSVLKHGFPASSLRVVAAEAGVPLSILHYYFTDKDDLMRSVAARIFDRAMARLAEARDRESEPLRRVEALIESYVMRTTEEWRASLAFIEYWAASVRKGVVDRFYTRVHFSYREILAKSLCDAGADDPDGLALALLGMMVGYTTFYKSKAPDPAERARMIEFARAMVRRAVSRGKARVRLVRHKVAPARSTAARTDSAKIQ